MSTPVRIQHVMDRAGARAGRSDDDPGREVGATDLNGIMRQVLRPPLGDRRFWYIQALILALVVGHLLLDVHVVRLPLRAPDYPTVGLFLLPVVYAALRFGLGGACASAAWGTLLMMPDLFVVDSRVDMWADGTLLVLICVVAVAVGQRVEKEMSARQRADAAISAHSAAEARFRALFEASSAPTLVADGSGALREANPAAKDLFGARVGRRRLADLVGAGVSRRLLTQTPPRVFTVALPDGATRALRPLSTLVTDSGGGALLQIIFQDVTEAAERQQLAEGYALQVLHVQEQERRRIGQDIHDEPLQTLIYLLRRLESIGAQSDLGAASRVELDGVRQRLVEVVVQLRQLADGLRPPVLDDIGLVASLRQLVERFAERAQTSAVLHVTGPEQDLGWDLKTDLYRILQEALHNVERHAHAAAVQVDLIFTKRTVRVRIRDDGDGFEVGGTPSGIGLRGMRERVALANGRVEIASSPGHGTTVRVSLPVPATPRPRVEMAAPRGAPANGRRPRPAGPTQDRDPGRRPVRAPGAPPVAAAAAAALMVPD